MDNQVPVGFYPQTWKQDLLHSSTLQPFRFASSVQVLACQMSLTQTGQNHSPKRLKQIIVIKNTHVRETDLMDKNPSFRKV